MNKPLNCLPVSSFHHPRSMMPFGCFLANFIPRMTCFLVHVPRNDFGGSFKRFSIVAFLIKRVNILIGGIAFLIPCERVRSIRQRGVFSPHSL